MDFILKSKSVMVLMLFIAAWALSIYIATLTPGLQHIGKSLIIQPELFDGSKMLFGILAVVFILFVLTLYSAQSALGIKTVALPALIYSVTTARLLPNVGFNDTLVAAICCALLLYVANLSVIKQKDNSPIFLFGFICVLMLMFAPKLVLIVPASLLILAFIGRFSLKDISALFIGWVAALILILTYLFATGNLTQFIGAWQNALFYRINGGFENVGEWKAAIDIWLAELDTSDLMKKACAEYNIAVACYMLGDYALALEWLDRSDSDNKMPTLSDAMRKRIKSRL